MSLAGGQQMRSHDRPSRSWCPPVMAEACAVTGRAIVTVPHVAHGTTECRRRAGSVAAEADGSLKPSTARRGMAGSAARGGRCHRSGVRLGRRGDCVIGAGGRRRLGGSRCRGGDFDRRMTVQVRVSPLRCGSRRSLGPTGQTGWCSGVPAPAP